MKTIIDAVNGLNGNFGCGREFETHVWFFDGDFELANHLGRQSENVSLAMSAWDLVCTVIELNSLVTELSNWQPTLPKVDTVEVDGMIYEIGKAYQTNERVKVTLINVEDGKFFVGRLGAGDFWGGWIEREIFKTTVDLGTITPAPKKLIDGEAYMFDCQGETRMGFKFGGYLRIDKYTKFSIGLCANITHLTAAK
jgi:hypothetical protein